MNESKPTEATAEDSRSLHDLQPDELVSGFNRSPIVLYGVLALVFHLVIIGALSVPTLMAWAGVTGDDKPEVVADPSQTSDPEAKDADDTQRAQDGEGQTAKAGNGEGTEGSSTSKDEKEPDPNSIESRKNTDVYKEATEATATPPSNPDDVDKPLDDGLFQTDNDL